MSAAQEVEGSSSVPPRSRLLGRLGTFCQLSSRGVADIGRYSIIHHDGMSMDKLPVGEHFH